MVRGKWAPFQAFPSLPLQLRKLLIAAGPTQLGIIATHTEAILIRGLDLIRPIRKHIFRKILIKAASYNNNEILNHELARIIRGQCPLAKLFFSLEIVLSEVKCHFCPLSSFLSDDRTPEKV